MIRVPIINYNSPLEIQLKDELTNLKNITYKFNKWECIQKRGVTGTTLTYDITNIYRNIENPKFIIVGFQDDRCEQQIKDPSYFDSMKVKNIRVKINETNYPDELQNLDINEGIYAVLFEMYKDFQNYNYGYSDVIYEPGEFVGNKCVYVIDTTKQSENIGDGKSNILINVDFSHPISGSNVIAYVVVVSEKTLENDIIKNTIKELN